MQPSPEEQYALLFPDQPIPSWALDKMKLFKDYDFTLGPGRREVVHLSQVVGTGDDDYGDILRWIDMLTRGQRRYNFALSNWPDFLNADTNAIEMVRIAYTDDFYIRSDGNHRVTALKLAGRASLSCLVHVAYPKLTTDENTVRRVDGLV